jgi:sigma-E processing peptidase SpoIIGA
MLTASIVGTIPSILIVLFLNNNLIINIIKFICAFIMLSFAFTQTKKQFIFNYILLFIYTYSLGGIITSLNSNAYYTNFGIVTTSKFSLEQICIIALIFTYILELSVKHLKLKFNTNSLIYSLTLTNEAKSVKINAYLDTGNFLNHNGQPVLILDLNIFLKLTNQNLITFLTSKTQTINTNTVTGTNQLKIFKVDEIKIQNGKTKNILKNQLVAINTTNCFKNTNYQALLSPLFL